MEIHDEYLQYTSKERFVIRDITGDINDVIKRSGFDSGIVGIYSLHTTFGLFVGERGEAGLPKDLIRYSLMMFPQDVRSALGHNPNYPYNVTDLEDNYQHDCSRNVYLRPGQVDERHNGAEHLRTHLYTQPEVVRPFRNNEVVLGQFQGIHTWECDGATGEERLGFEEMDCKGRTRLVYVCATRGVFRYGGKKVTIIDS